MKRIANKNYLEGIFLSLQAILYVSFLVLDLTSGNNSLSVGIKYTVILLCFCYALFAKGAYKSIFLIQVALLFTMISDLFILILDYYIYGVVSFILVQQLYSLRLVILQYDGRHKVLALYCKRLLLHITLATAVYLVLNFSGIALESLLIASVFYFICIISNTFTAIGLAVADHNNKSNLYYAAGMLLFLLCDINVGLFNLSGFITLPIDIYSVIYSFSSILMWTFYAPSQVLIAISSHYSTK